MAMLEQEVPKLGELPGRMVPARINPNLPVGNDLKTFAQYIDRRKGSLAMVAASHMRPERLIKIVLGAVTRTPALRSCSIESLFRCSLMAAELGLEPNSPLGECWFVPFKTECQLIIDYRGLVTLARRSGEVLTVNAFAVYDGDIFDVTLGTEPEIKHIPDFTAERDPAKVLFVYAVAELKGGGRQFDIMTRGEVDAIRRRSRAGNSGPWVTDYVEMAKKTVVRRLCKLLPKSVEMAKALAVENATDTGDFSAIDAEWVDAGVIDSPRPNGAIEDAKGQSRAKVEAAAAKMRAPEAAGPDCTCGGVKLGEDCTASCARNGGTLL